MAAGRRDNDGPLQQDRVFADCGYQCVIIALARLLSLNSCSPVRTIQIEVGQFVREPGSFELSGGDFKYSMISGECPCSCRSARVALDSNSEGCDRW
ncbi:MAG: hypothetical protein CM1200mP18_08770 [Gammaproteobacteria bacterium]|nr:MAG: hypothetical protein CM1200mP18_08770 [Gammaproteobacteria bacterium]